MFLSLRVYGSVVFLTTFLCFTAKEKYYFIQIGSVGTNSSAAAEYTVNTLRDRQEPLDVIVID